MSKALLLAYLLLVALAVSGWAFVSAQFQHASTPGTSERTIHNTVQQRRLLSDKSEIFKDGKSTLKDGLEIASAVVLEAASAELIDLAVEGSL